MKPSKKSKLFQTPKGMRDILPEEQIYWQKINQVVKNIAAAYGFDRIDTPILEETDLFNRGTGPATDVVEKEMYSLKTKGGDALSLRPEFTPAIVRAYLEHGLFSWPQPVKLYTVGPLFRYEHPQAGRFRQHHQIDFEIIGDKEPVLDSQIIQCFFIIFKELGLKGVNVQINSVGCYSCRPVYRKLLVNYYRSKTKLICVDCRERLTKNPLRLLDCRQESCKKIAKGAPQIIDSLCPECRRHFKSVLEFLDELDLPYFLNGHLVRGLDYYTKTVFEFWPEEVEGKAQAALGGGGRYDNLAKVLGGRPTPAVGAGAGIERIIAFMKAKGVKMPAKSPPKIFLVQLGDLGRKKSLKLFEELRRAGLLAVESLSRDSLKSQLKIADKLGAKFSLILGQKEALDETIIIRDMSSGSQEIAPLRKAIKEMKKRLKK